MCSEMGRDDDTFDPWMTVSGEEEYASLDTRGRHKFYVGGAERTGPQVNTKVAATQHELMQKWVQSGKFPLLRTIQDLVRDAVYWRLRDLASMVEGGMPPELEALHASMMAEAKVEERRAAHARDEAFVMSARQLFEEQRRADDLSGIAFTLQAVEERSVSMVSVSAQREIEKLRWEMRRLIGYDD